VYEGAAALLRTSCTYRSAPCLYRPEAKLFTDQAAHAPFGTIAPKAVQCLNHASSLQLLQGPTDADWPVSAVLPVKPTDAPTVSDMMQLYELSPCQSPNLQGFDGIPHAFGRLLAEGRHPDIAERAAAVCAAAAAPAAAAELGGHRVELYGLPRERHVPRAATPRRMQCQRDLPHSAGTTEDTHRPCRMFVIIQAHHERLHTQGHGCGAGTCCRRISVAPHEIWSKMLSR